MGTHQFWQLPVFIGCIHLLNCQCLSEFKFRASLTSAIVILARILSIGMYFAYLLVKAEAKAEAIKNIR